MAKLYHTHNDIKEGTQDEDINETQMKTGQKKLYWLREIERPAGSIMYKPLYIFFVILIHTRCYSNGSDWRIVAPSVGMFNLVLRLLVMAAGVVEVVTSTGAATVVLRRRPLIVEVAGVVVVVDVVVLLLDAVESGREGSECWSWINETVRTFSSLPTWNRCGTIDSGFVFFVERLGAAGVVMDSVSVSIVTREVLEDSIVGRKRISVMGCKCCCCCTGETLAATLWFPDLWYWTTAL